jgi:hypothetical protein
MKTSVARAKLNSIPALHDFRLSAVDKARMKLHRYELDERIETLSRNIYVHEFNADFTRSVLDWRRELMDAKLERAALLSAHL